MTERMAYVDSIGRVPRGMTEATAVQALQTVALIQIARGICDLRLNPDRIIVCGLSEPTAIAQIIDDWEIAVRGLGDGCIEIRAIRKGGDPTKDTDA